MSKYLFYIIALIVLCSCNTKDRIENRLDDIKELGNSYPKSALMRLDSLIEEEIPTSQHIQSNIDLLKIRLNDKADIIPSGDTDIKKLIEYFDKHGNCKEKQEVHFYGGSTYRDLHDFPSAIEHFLQSIKKAEESNGLCDSILLRNAYSNLSFLFNQVQDNESFLKYATLEYNISLQLGKIEPTTLTHLGDAYMLVDSLDQAYIYFDKAFQIQREKPNVEILSHLLLQFSYTGNMNMASDCFSLLSNIEQNRIERKGSKELFAYGEYYYHSNQNDSAKIYFQEILRRRKNLQDMYDASRILFRIYSGEEKTKEANKYATDFIQICSTLNLGKRQELAATVNNMFQYQLNKEEEQRVKDENTRMRTLIVAAIVFFVVILLLSLSYFVYRKNILLREIIQLNNEINSIKEECRLLSNEIQEKNKELDTSKDELTNNNLEIERIRTVILNLNNELSKAKEDLMLKEQLLQTRTEQSHSYLKLLHQSQLELNSEDVINSLRKTASGRKTMSSSDWKQLYQAVDEMDPSFHSQLLNNGPIEEKQMQVCYLMRVGLSKTQIQNITELSRVTIWRWCKKYDWVYYCSEG